MNKRVENRMRQIEANIAVISEELGLDRKATYRYVFETGLACVRACAGERAHTCTGERAGVPAGVRTPPRKRVLILNSNLSIKGSRHERAERGERDIRAVFWEGISATGRNCRGSVGRKVPRRRGRRARRGSRPEPPRQNAGQLMVGNDQGAADFFGG